MKWFWYSLIGFCLLMCSCKSKESARLINEVSKENTETNYTKYQALVGTSNSLKIDIDKSKMTITEHVTTTKYDKDTGAITEKTETERTIAQDSDKVVSTEEEKGLSEVRNDSLNQFRGVTKKMESEVKEESTGGQEALGKWFGIVIGCVIGFLIVYLLGKCLINNNS